MGLVIESELIIPDITKFMTCDLNQNLKRCHWMNIAPICHKHGAVLSLLEMMRWLPIRRAILGC